MARRLFRKKRPQQSRYLAVFLIAVLCLGVGYALWFTDGTRQRETAQINAPVATDADQPIKLPSGFGAAFIDRPSMRIGSLVENDRRSEESAAAPPVVEPSTVDLPVPRSEPAVKTVRPTPAPAASQPVASGNAASGQSGEQPRAAARTTPPAAPESSSAGLATEPAAGPAAPPSPAAPAAPVEPVTVAVLTAAPAATAPSEPAVVPETTEWVPRPVPRARQADVPQANVPDVNDEETIDVGRPAPAASPAPSSRDDTFAIVAAPLRPVVVPPSVDDEPLTVERESSPPPVDDSDVDLPPATSRNVARSLVTTAVRDREPARALGETVSLREIDRGQLIYFTELTGLMGRKVEHRWIYRGRVEGTMRFQVGSNRWRASSRKTVLPHQKGEWRVIVVDEAGRTLGGSRLVVE
ncbi:MAG: DUF2914 domain-containing protein [Defluviicoccus sp.]|nr:DUF2914 domain-containing protein [Defluviicoccus sp.]